MQHFADAWPLPRTPLVDSPGFEATLAYAGVGFRLRFRAGEGELCLPGVYRDYVKGYGEVPCVAQVVCQLDWDSKLGPAAGPLDYLRWRRGGGESAWQVANNRLRAVVRRVAPQRYEARVSVAHGVEACAALVRQIAALLVEAEGGLNLHAAALDLDGVAVIFTGPSGAGKSTACELAPSARCLAYDQLTVYPVEAGFRAWALPWGNPTRLARSSACELPVAAVLRVVRGASRPTVTLAEPGAGLFVVRDAATVSDDTLEAEQQRLEASLTLCSRVPVGHIHTVLGHPVDGLLRDWLKRSEGF